MHLCLALLDDPEVDVVYNAVSYLFISYPKKNGCRLTGFAATQHASF